MKKRLLTKTATALIIAVVALAGCKKDPVKVSGVTLNKTTLELAAGGSETLMATVMPADAENKAITWSSSDCTVATVDQNGNVTAVKAGTATVTVTTADGGFTATCAVTVTAEETPENRITFSFTGNIGGNRDHGLAGFALAGSGEATIDWGDGSAVQTVTLNPLPENHASIGYPGPYNIWVIPHTYAPGTEPRTVAITGNISGMVTPEVVDNFLLPEEHGSLESLDVSRMPGLQVLICRSGDLPALDVSKNTALTHLDCSFNQLRNLDISRNPALLSLSCLGNSISSLDISGHTALTTLQCGYNPLTLPDLSRHTELELLDCGSLNLTVLDVSRQTKLRSLYCNGNPLMTLDVSANTELRNLTCENCGLTSIDVSKNTKLLHLYCRYNLFSTLSISTPALLSLYCSGNGEMTSLVLETPSLITLDCRGTRMYKDAMVAVFQALPSHVGTYPGTMLIDGYFSELLTAEELAIATDKNWRVE